MTDGPEPQNPLDAVFEMAVRPFADAEALRAALPAEAPVVVMRKFADMAKESRTLPDGATLTVPVLDALRRAALAEWHFARAFEFAALAPDDIALVVMGRDSAEPALRVITRTSGGGFLCADVDGMLDALGAVVDTPAFEAFPGADVMVEALSSGVRSVKAEVLKSLQTPDSSGKSPLEQFRAAATDR